METRVAVLAAVMGPLAAFAQSPSEDLLAKYQTWYQGELTKIETEHAAGTNQIPSWYRQQLTAVREQRKQAGDLEGVLAVDRETSRFEKEQTLPEATADVPSAIAAIRASTMQYLGNLESAKQTKYAALLKRYLASLDILKKAFVRDGKLDDAIRVNAEMKKIEFIAADLASKMPVPQPAAKASVTPTITSRQPAGKNYIENGDFEGDSHAPWTAGGWGAQAWMQVQKGDGHESKGALLFGKVKQASDFSARQKVFLRPGHYTISFYVKVIENTGGVNLRYRGRPALFDLAAGEIPPDLRTWKRFEIDVRVPKPEKGAKPPEGAKTGEVAHTVVFHMEGDGKVLLDDIVLTDR